MVGFKFLVIKVYDFICLWVKNILFKVRSESVKVFGVGIFVILKFVLFICIGVSCFFWEFWKM